MPNGYVPKPIFRAGFKCANLKSLKYLCWVVVNDTYFSLYQAERHLTLSPMEGGTKNSIQSHLHYLDKSLMVFDTIEINLQ